MRAESLSCKGNITVADLLALSSSVAKAFGQLLKSHITARGWTLRGFDRAVSSGNGYVAHVCRAASPPPDATTLSLWAQKLELSDAEVGELLRLADIARSAHTSRRAPGVAALQAARDRAERALLDLAPSLEAMEKASNGAFKIPERVRQAIEVIKRERAN